MAAPGAARAGRPLAGAVPGVLLAAVLLAGCAAKSPLPPVDIPLRNPTAPVGSQADATLARLAGRWQVIEAAGIAPGAEIDIDAATMRIDGVALPLTEQAAGRLRVGGEQIWVHWLDADNRTAALGEPGGARVWIMDRTGAPGERRAAAREILAWYGYDLSRLSEL